MQGCLFVFLKVYFFLLILCVSIWCVYVSTGACERPEEAFKFHGAGTEGSGELLDVGIGNFCKSRVSIAELAIQPREYRFMKSPWVRLEHVEGVMGKYSFNHSSFLSQLLLALVYLCYCDKILQAG